MTTAAADAKKADILQFLHTHVFDPVLNSQRASVRLKRGTSMTIVRCEQRDAAGIWSYYWSAVVGTENSTKFARMMRAEGFTRFEDPGVIDEFRERFTEAWARPEL